MDSKITGLHIDRLQQAYVSHEGTRGLNAHIENDTRCFWDTIC